MKLQKNILAKAIFGIHHVVTNDMAQAVHPDDVIKLPETNSQPEGADIMELVLNLISGMKPQHLNMIAGVNESQLSMAAKVGFVPDVVQADCEAGYCENPVKLGDELVVISSMPVPRTMEEYEEAVKDMTEEERVDFNTRELVVKRTSDGAEFKLPSGILSIRGTTVNGRDAGEVANEAYGEHVLH